MSGYGEVEAAGARTQGRMRQALRDAVARAGGARGLSGLSLIAVLCASAVAPVALVSSAIGPVLTAWLTTAGAVGSNLLAEVITSVAGRSEEAGVRAAPEVELMVAVELEARMAAPGRQAAALRGDVAGLLRERGAQQVLLEALAQSDGELQEVLAEGMALLAGRFAEFAGLVGAVREGVRELQAAAGEQREETQLQERHRGEVQQALARILQLLEDGSPARGGTGAVYDTAAYNTLPPDIATFTGREPEIAAISARVEAAAAFGGVVTIHAIDGMPGVGKTTLAIYIAHRLSARFPDRQLFVDLHAHTAGRSPADPAATLASLLIGEGMDPRQLPAALDELSTLWRARMAARRAVLVLDNAADSGQVAPLLPGGAGCLVLITSRRHLGDLPYTVADISLDVLAPQEAVALFLRLCPQPANQDEQVAQVVALAGYLPLAITLLARVYARHRAWSMGDLLRETDARLLTLTAEHHTIAAAFDLSYQTLAPPRQRFFRLLSLHPGGDLDPYAAAALTNTDLPQAEEHLKALYGDHLLTEPAYHRYGMHDLIRAYARDLAAGDPPDLRQAAIERLLDYYQHTATQADAHIARYTRTGSTGPIPAHAPALTSPDAARRWLRTERANLEACLQHATDHHQDKRSVALSAGLAGLLSTDGPWLFALSVLTAAATTAARLGDRLAQANALIELGRLRFFMGDYPAAVQTQHEALELYRGLDNRIGQANALTFLGQLRGSTGDYEGAIQDHQDALELHRELDDHYGQANALLLLGQMWSATGNHEGAAQSLQEALDAYRELGDQIGQASALTYLGQVRLATGDYSAAVRDQQQALELSRDLGTRRGQANALTELGRIRLATGDYPGAVRDLQEALELHREIGARGNEAYTLNHYAAALAATGHAPQALAIYRDALDLTREVQQPDDEALALEGIGELLLRDGDAHEAAEHLAQALAIFQHLGMAPDTTRLQARLDAITTP